MLAPVPVPVECRAGYKGEEYPLAVHVADERREVSEILDRWYQGAREPGLPAAEYFKVRTAQGAAGAQARSGSPRLVSDVRAVAAARSEALLRTGGAG